MSKDHDEARLQDHVVAHVGVVARHHNHGLLVRDSTANILKFERESLLFSNLLPIKPFKGPFAKDEGSYLLKW